jgi:hypothetical protein
VVHRVDTVVTVKATNGQHLLTQAGTYYVYAQTSGKSGGSGSPSTNDTNKGYHDLTSSYVTVFQQYEDTGPYTANYVQWQLRTARQLGLVLKQVVLGLTRRLIV